ncbi:Heme oxygenase [compost metagenome]
MDTLTLRGALKAHTGALHERLEAGLDLTGPHLDRERYAAMMARFHGFYAALEPALLEAAWPDHGVVYAERLKTPALRRDLAAFGTTPDAVDQLPVCEALPRVDTPARRLGCMYVLEGSTLGGQFLSRHFATALGLTPETGCAFFSGYGPATGPRWAAFVKLLDALDSPDTRAEALEAALETFEKLEAWMVGSPGAAVPQAATAVEAG